MSPLDTRTGMLVLLLCAVAVGAGVSAAPIAVGLSGAIVAGAWLLAALVKRPRALLLIYVGACYLSPALGTKSVSVTFADYAGIGIIWWWLISAGHRTRTPGLSACFVLAISAMLSLASLATIDPSLLLTSFFHVPRLIVAGTAGVLAADLARRDPDVARLLIRAVGICAAIGAIVAIAAYAAKITLPFVHAEEDLYLSSGARLRGVGLVGEASSLGNELLFALIIVGVAGGYCMSRRLRVAILIACAGGIVVTFARTDLVLLALALSAVVASRHSRLRVGAAWAVVAVAAGLTVVPGIVTGIDARLASSAAATGINGFASGRIANWAAIISHLGGPLLIALGHGYKTITGGPLVSVSVASPIYGDNTLLSALYETGATGLLLVLAGAALMWQMLRRRAGDVNGGEALRYALLLWMAMEVINGAIGDVLTYFRTLGPWFAVYGSYVGMIAVARTEDNRNPERSRSRYPGVYGAGGPALGSCGTE